MSRPPAAKSQADIRPRIRVYLGKDIALGPGKSDLLLELRKTKNLRKAAARMKMSYMRAWLLVKEMNRCFKKPLVSALRGGTGGGSATLTPEGEQALDLYLAMEVSATKAIRPIATKIKKRMHI